jgi:hypothetical protein
MNGVNNLESNVANVPTMSMASSPNALAAITICERVYRSSRRVDDLIIPVSAQSGALVSQVNKTERETMLQSSAANLIPTY